MEQIDVNKVNNDLKSPLFYATSTKMITLLLKHGSDPNQLDPFTKKTVFDHFLEFMPEGCNAILDHFIMLNGSSLQGNDLKITLDFKIVHPSNDIPEMKFLHDIVLAKKIDLLKHPICESFLHMKWIQLKKYFYSYFVIYLLFLLSFNTLVFLDQPLSSALKGNCIGI